MNKEKLEKRKGTMPMSQHEIVARWGNARLAVPHTLDCGSNRETQESYRMCRRTVGGGVLNVYLYDLPQQVIDALPKKKPVHRLVVFDVSIVKITTVAGKIFHALNLRYQEPVEEEEKHPLLQILAPSDVADEELYIKLYRLTGALSGAIALKEE